MGISVRGVGGLVATLSAARNALAKDAAYEVYTDVEYAKHQEYGTSRHSAQPFMGPGAAAAQARLGQFTSSADSTDDIARQVAEAAQSEAKSRAPVDTGQLRDSISVRKIR